MGPSPETEIDRRTFVEAMTLPVRQAMAAVRWLEGRVANRPKLEELTPEKAALTDGDCVSQEILLVALHAHFPWVEIQVEENTPSTALFRESGPSHTVVIDPIDGTLRYLRGDGPYAILVGLECEGRVEAAIVALPQSQVLLRAIRGAGAEISQAGAPFRRAVAAGRGQTLLVSYGLPNEVRTRLEAMGHDLVTAAGGAIGVAPVLEGTAGALRLTTAPEGLSRRAWISALPTLEAGGAVEGIDGDFPEQYTPGVLEVVVGPSKDAVARLREALR